LTSPRTPRRPFRASALALAAALLLAGCGGGGGGNDHDSVVCTNLTFDRAMVTPGAGDIYMDQASSTCSSLDVVILVSNLTGIFTVGFDLTYPNALQYQSYSLGPLMLKGNPANQPAVIVLPTTNGVKVGVSRLSPDPPVSATGSEALIRLHFVRAGSGSGVFDFYTGPGDPVSESVLDDQSPPNAAPAVWTPNHGGMVAIP
jgi:hypothetical protein